jgi:hypothetical protein
MLADGTNAPTPPEKDGDSWSPEAIAYVQEQVLRVAEGKSLVEIADALTAAMKATPPAEGASKLLAHVLLLLKI